MLVTWIVLNFVQINRGYRCHERHDSEMLFRFSSVYLFMLSFVNISTKMEPQTNFSTICCLDHSCYYA
jgi:hypothetical protein